MNRPYMNRPYMNRPYMNRPCAGPIESGRFVNRPCKTMIGIFMNEFKIILFCCNWCPHAALLTLQDQRADLPPEIKMVRIPCSGRISKALLFKAFELGADGVVLMGCKPGSCRYGTGSATASKNTADTREILTLLGIGAERLRLMNFLPDESEALLASLVEFAADIRRMGKSPIRALPFDAREIVEKPPEAIVAVHDVFACQDCGKCTSACSLALAGKPFSPRAVVSDIIAGRADTQAVRESVNACLTCGVCYDRCPSAVNFPEFIKDMRTYYHGRRLTEAPSHGGFFQSMMRAMTTETLQTQRYTHLSEGIRTKKGSPILFFGGCAPYFDIFFHEFLGVNTHQILEDSLRLLNFFDIEPAVLENERCCGHDLLWSGDRGNFLRLARLNARAIKESGAEELITACPECYHTLHTEYRRYGIPLPIKVTHMHAFLEREIGKGAVRFKPLGERVAFQDACRQSRFDGEAALPRKLIRYFAPNDVAASPETQAMSICCGNSAWTGCDAHSKAMQVERLKQARETDCEVMITACPKCQIHLRCAMEDAMRRDDLEIKMMDLTSAIAKTIYWG
jgi:heterodisulfide reductase subunit D